MEANRINNSEFLTACLCKLQLPHTEEHVKFLPKPVMPTLCLPAEQSPVYDPVYEQSKRVKDLLADVDAARAEDLKLQVKFDKEAAELLKAYKEGLKCEHWVPQEIQESGADESTVRLKYELNHSRFQLAEVRNQLHSLRREMAAHERLVRQEIGDNASLHDILTSSRWRGRAQEIKRLKKEIADMESKAYDYKYMKNPLCIPTYKPRFPDVNDLVPREQVRALQNEARKKKDQRERTEREVTALLDQYGNISLMYKASLTHNKMLAEELKTLKDQLSKYQEQAKEDGVLMRNLIAHQLNMREMVNREAYLARLVKKKQHEEMDLVEENVVDGVKYKGLWEASEAEKFSLEKMLEMLNKRLDDVLEMAKEAEKHSDENEAKRKEINSQIEAQKKEAETSTKSKESKGKAEKVKESKGKAEKESSKPTDQVLGTDAPFNAVKKENAFLRDFLLKAIQTKVEDLKLYQFAMNSVREQYVETVKELNAPPPPDSAEGESPLEVQGN